VPAATATIASAVISRLPFLPSSTEWLHATRTSVVMDIGKAKSILGWSPEYTALETLQSMAAAL
jgi:UDP-glucose 4-epimerase